MNIPNKTIISETRSIFSKLQTESSDKQEELH